MAAPPSTPAFPLLEEEMPPWRLYLSPRGRIGRRHFWLHGALALFGVTIVLTMLLRIAGMSAGLADGVANLALAWPFLAIAIKRWHDRDRSGWWVLLSAAPVALALLVPRNEAGMFAVGILALGCWLWSLVQTGFLPGTPGPNRFGDAPRPD